MCYKKRLFKALIIIRIFLTVLKEGGAVKTTTFPVWGPNHPPNFFFNGNLIPRSKGNHILQPSTWRYPPFKVGTVLVQLPS